MRGRARTETWTPAIRWQARRAPVRHLRNFVAVAKIKEMGVFANRTYRWRAGQIAALILIGLFLATAGAVAASITASLDQDSVPVGQSVTLTLTFEGGAPDSAPALPAVPNLRIIGTGSSRNMVFAGGHMETTMAYTFSVTPLQPGVYSIPAVVARVGGNQVASQALKLTALAPGAATQDQTNAPQLVFMRLNTPEKQAFVGQAITVELLVCVRDGLLNGEEILRAFDAYNGTPITAEGFRVIKTVHGQRRRAQVGSAAYTVASFLTGIVPAKPGKLSLSSIEVPLTVQIPIAGRRRDVFDPFGMFQQAEERRLVVVSPPAEIDVSPLPGQNVPKDFTGAVGDYQVKVQASPTNVAAGDPITVRIRLEGQGDLESLNLPPLESADFKSYPPSSSVEPSDALNFSGAKVFEQVMVPQTANASKLPGISFSFFNPKSKQYRTVVAPPVEITVRPGSGTPSPVIASPRTQKEEAPPPALDIVPIKRRLGVVANLSRPLYERPAFLALQIVPVALLLLAVFWRKRHDSLANNPRLRRQLEMRRKFKSGLAELKRLASQNNTQEFYDLVFRLLQEQTGERLNVAAASITAAVVEERLEPAGLPPEFIARLRALFQQCDQARYAPVKSASELQDMVPRVEQILSELAEVKL